MAVDLKDIDLEDVDLKEVDLKDVDLKMLTLRPPARQNAPHRCANAPSYNLKLLTTSSSWTLCSSIAWAAEETCSTSAAFCWVVLSSCVIATLT